MSAFNYLILLIILIVIPSAVGWEQEGHMLIGQIAINLLNDSTQFHLRNAINTFYFFFPNHSEPLSATVWADYIRNLYLNEFTTWHYINKPWDPQGIKTVHPKSSAAINIVWALQNTLNTLKYTSNTWARAFATRFLLHLVGDIHQPLHNINYYSKRYPNGDNGGNLFKIKIRGKTMNLHYFWDSAGLQYSTHYALPLSKKNKEKITKMSKHLMNKYPHFSVNNHNFTEWSNESYRLAIKFSYTPILTNTTITQNYILETRIICEKQIVKAGYRLASLIKQIFTTN